MNNYKKVFFAFSIFQKCHYMSFFSFVYEGLHSNLIESFLFTLISLESSIFKFLFTKYIPMFE